MLNLSIKPPKIVTAHLEPSVDRGQTPLTKCDPSLAVQRFHAQLQCRNVGIKRRNRSVSIVEANAFVVLVKRCSQQGRIRGGDLAPAPLFESEKYADIMRKKNNANISKLFREGQNVHPFHISKYAPGSHGRRNYRRVQLLA